MNGIRIWKEVQGAETIYHVDYNTAGGSRLYVQLVASPQDLARLAARAAAYGIQVGAEDAATEGFFDFVKKAMKVVGKIARNPLTQAAITAIAPGYGNAALMALGGAGKLLEGAKSPQRRKRVAARKAIKNLQALAKKGDVKAKRDMRTLNIAAKLMTDDKANFPPAASMVLPAGALLDAQEEEEAAPYASEEAGARPALSRVRQLARRTSYHANLLRQVRGLPAALRK